MRLIYTAVQQFFIAIALSAIGSVVSNIDALAGLGNLLTLAGGLLSIVAIHRLRHENKHFSKAIRYFWIYFGLSIVMAIAAVAVLVSSLARADSAQGAALTTLFNASLVTSILLLVMAVVVLVLALAMQYQTYAGFEELRELRDIHYPPKRILWCFYIAVISMIISIVAVAGSVFLLIGALTGGDAALYAAIDTLDMAANVMLVIGVVIEAVQLWLVFTYMQAVKAAMDAERPENWG